MDLFGLTGDETAVVLDLLPFAARTARTMDATATR
jgi:hypothetical protein